MELSLSPFRWYDKIHKQNRFDNECGDTCQFKLITPRTQLLPFQFTRPASGYGIDKWLLRPACKDYETPLLNAYNFNFASGMDWKNYGDFTFDCGTAKSGLVDFDEMQLNGILTIGKKYRAVFFCNDYKRAVGSTLYLSLNNGALIVVDNVTTAGYYEGEFTAATTDIQFVIHNAGGSDPDDFIGVSEVQIYEVFEQKSFDIELKKTLIMMQNVGANDYFVYCGQDLGQVIPAGEYYSIIVEDSGLTYISEVITVKDFLLQKNPYYTLHWKNECDIGDMIYSSVGCAPYNILFLEDAAISKPKYPFKEEGEENGESVFNPTFQKLEKTLDFIIAKCPEFIVDALAGIRLHDTIHVTPPYRKNEVFNHYLNTYKEVKSIEYEINPVFDDCYSNVTLKMLMGDMYLDSACCVPNEFGNCTICTKTWDSFDAPLEEPENGDIIVVWEEELFEGPGWYVYNSGTEEWEKQLPVDGFVICGVIKTLGNRTLIWFTGQWHFYPGIDSVSWDSDYELLIVQGFIPPGYFAQAETSFDGVTWTPQVPIVNAGYYLFGLLQIPFPDPHAITPVYVRVKCFNMSCNLGYTDIAQYDFEANGIEFEYSAHGGTMNAGEDIHNTGSGADAFVMFNNVPDLTMAVNSTNLADWNIGNICNNSDGDEIWIETAPYLIRG